MTRVELTLPDGLDETVRRLAAQHGVSANDLIVRTLAERFEAMRTFDELRAGAARGSPKHFQEFLARVPDGPPVAGDELPAGFKLPD